MLNLAEYRQRPALLADWLPWAGLIATGIVLNKDGSFQRTARFRGPDLDSATQGELIATSARLNNALRRLGSGWALFIEAERRPAADYPHSEFPEPLSWLVDEERRAAFEESGNHFESAYHLTLAYLPPEESRARAAKLLYEHAPGDGVDWRGRLDAFAAETDRVFDLLDGVMPEIAWLDDAQTLTYLHAAVSTRRYRVGVPEVPFHLDALLADSALVGASRPCWATSICAWCRCGLSDFDLAGDSGRPQPPGLRLPLEHSLSVPRQSRGGKRTGPPAPPVVCKKEERRRAAARNHLPAGKPAGRYRRQQQGGRRRCRLAGAGQRSSRVRLSHRHRDGARYRPSRGRREAAHGGARHPGPGLRHHP